jgi:hypothetical protein
MYSLSRNLSSEPTVKPTACAKTTSKNVDVATSLCRATYCFCCRFGRPDPEGHCHGGGTLPLTHGEKTTAFAEN